MPDQVVTILPTMCVWFAWAPSTEVGPSPWKEKVSDHAPLKLGLGGLAAVDVEVVTTEIEWRHGPGADMKATAAGRTRKEATKADYSDAKYRNTNLTGVSMPLCALVGLIADGFDNPPSVPTVIEEIGLGPKQMIIPAGLTEPTLYLGMHDGYEWNNNFMVDPEEAMLVRITTHSFLAGEKE